MQLKLLLDSEAFWFYLGRRPGFLYATYCSGSGCSSSSIGGLYLELIVFLGHSTVKIEPMYMTHYCALVSRLLTLNVYSFFLCSCVFLPGGRPLVTSIFCYAMPRIRLSCSLSFCSSSSLFEKVLIYSDTCSSSSSCFNTGIGSGAATGFGSLGRWTGIK